MGRRKKNENVPAKKADLQLVASNGKFIFCDSRMVASKFEVEHKKVVRTIELVISKMSVVEGDLKSYSNDPFEAKFVRYEDSYHGKKFTAYRMNKTAFSLIAMRFETKAAFKWQILFVKAFAKMENDYALLKNQQANQEWLETRKAGKLIRRVETDVVQRFVDYATAQGSQSAHHYYSNISTMQNKALFFLDQKYKNVRDLLDVEQLWTLASADKIVAKALEEGMNRGLHYKEIYRLAKTNVETFASIHGKSLIPNNQLKLAAAQ